MTAKKHHLTRIDSKNNSNNDGLKDIFEISSNRQEDKQPDVPELVKVVVGLLAWPIAQLAERDRFKGHEIRKVIQDGGTTAAVEWVVTPHPKFGMPTMLTIRLLFALANIAYELKQSCGSIPDLIPIGSWNNLCRLVGITPSSGNRVLLKRHLRILHFTAINSKTAFKTSNKAQGISDNFFLVSSVRYAGEKDDQGQIYDQTHIRMSRYVLESIENNYVKTIDLNFMAELSKETAQLLYTKISYALQNAMTHGREHAELSYQWLAETMGLTVYQDRWRAKEQLMPALQELVNKCYIAMPCWDKWDRWILIVSPGVRFTMGEQLQLKARRNAVMSKKVISKRPVIMTSPTASVDVNNNDARETALIIEAGKILAKMEPNKQKLKAHGWTVEDAQCKAEELRKNTSLQQGSTADVDQL